MSDIDRGHVTEYVAPSGEPDATPSGLTDKSHVPNYVAPSGPEDPGGMDRGHLGRLYVSPLPDPKDAPPSDPQQVERERVARELAEHEALVRRIQEEERAAKLADPNTEGQD